MEQAVNSLITALTTSISTYAVAVGNGIVNIFKYTFLQVNANGTIVGLNFLGYTSIIFISLIVLIVVITIVTKKITDAYRMKEIANINNETFEELANEWYQDFLKDYKNSYRDIVYSYFDDIYDGKL